MFHTTTIRICKEEEEEEEEEEKEEAAKQQHINAGNLEVSSNRMEETKVPPATIA